MRIWLFILIAFLFTTATAYCQPCTNPGQTPSTAFSVCSSTIYRQPEIPRCTNNKLFVPSCSLDSNDPSYEDKNPIWYKFTCSTSGTLGFHIDPNAPDEDYDW